MFNFLNIQKTEQSLAGEQLLQRTRVLSFILIWNQQSKNSALILIFRQMLSFYFQQFSLRQTTTLINQLFLSSYSDITYVLKRR